MEMGRFPSCKFDHCRIGSLEKELERTDAEIIRSLPHRQLRNKFGIKQYRIGRSLPHRQLRKLTSRLMYAHTVITAA